MAGQAGVVKLLEEMAEYVCDSLCRHPLRVDITQEELGRICEECKLRIQLKAWRSNLKAIKAFLSGEWVESDRVQEIFGMSFSECFARFEFSRTAEWWSIVGKTEEERQREGQKVTACFRLRRRNQY